MRPVQVNEALSKFLKERRTALGKSRSEIGKLVGFKNIGQYQYYELNGQLPKKQAVVEALANALRATVQELQNLDSRRDIRAGENLLALIKVIAQSKCMLVTKTDLMFLQNLQESFAQPMTPQFIEEALRLRTAPADNGPACAAPGISLTTPPAPAETSTVANS